MDKQYHLWFYIKDFAVFNVKQSQITLPSELIHYIYTYIVNNELLQKINDNYIVYNINKQLDNNRRWRAGLEDARKFAEGEGFLKNINRLPNVKKSNALDIREEVIIHMKNLPYPSMTDFEKLFWNIEKLVQHKKYSYITCNKNRNYWGQLYKNMQLENKSETVDRLIIKIYTKEEKVKKRELFFVI
jgi:hypothetical protein